jgi:hypothetical protein
MSDLNMPGEDETDLPPSIEEQMAEEHGGESADDEGRRGPAPGLDIALAPPD